MGYRLLPTGLVSDALREDVLRAVDLIVEPHAVKDRSGLNVPLDMPRRYDLSLGGVVGRYGECVRVRRRHKWVDKLPGAAAMYGRLRELAQRLGEHVGGTRAYFSVLAVEAGALEQEYHADNYDAEGAYWTVLMPLTTDDPLQVSAAINDYVPYITY